LIIESTDGYDKKYTETTRSIPNDDRKYDVHLWEVHTRKMGSTHTVDGK
jgi:hypothetical protein